MRAELRSLESTDYDLREFVPESEAYCVAVTAEIGAIGEKGADLFNFEVCSPAWLESAIAADRVVSGRHKFFMSQFNYDALEAYVTKRVRQVEGPDWQTVASKLSRWAYWEFEDYQE